MCVKRSKHCYGYREEVDLVFCDQNELIRRKARQTRKAAKSIGSPDFPVDPDSSNDRLSDSLVLAGSSESRENSALLSRRLPASSTDPNISKIQLDVPDREQALSLFFHQYVAHGDADGEIPGFNDTFPVFYQQALPNSCMKHCVAAAAYASLANQSQSLAVSRKAWEAYGTALSSVNAALADPVGALKDETLCAIFILGMFENISAKQSQAFGVHGCGLDRLLHLRGKQQFETEYGEQVSRAVCAFLQIRNLNLGRQPPPHEEYWFMNVRGCVPYRRAMSSMSRICRVRAAAKELLTSIDNSPFEDSGASLSAHCAALTDLVAEMQLVNSDHWLWIEGASSVWNYSAVNAPRLSLKRRSHPDEAVHIYHNFWTANLWNWTRTSCIFLQNSLLKCLRKLSSISLERLPNHDTIEANAQVTIKSIIRDICASVPFLMGDIDSQGNVIETSQRFGYNGQSMAQLWLLWHFHIMSASGFALSHQLMLIKETCDRIGYGKGIRQAVL
jgi:hypothetical protein